MIMSGFCAIAASMLAIWPCVSPGLETKIIWQSAWIRAQASSMPFLTVSQKALLLSEWVV